MRLYPSPRGPFSNRWQFLLLFAVLGVVLVVEMQRNNVDPQPAIATVQIPTKRVVVAKVQLEPGKPIAKESLVLEDRPVATLPADVATAVEEVVGLKPAGVIAATYPLAKSLIAVEEEKPTEPQTDPIEERLAAIRKETVGFAITFSSPAPERGTRVAIVLQGAKGGSALVAEEAWIDESDGKPLARVLLRPASALFFQEAKTLGSFSYLVIPSDGASPFESKAVRNLTELNAELTKANKDEKPPTPVEVRREPTTERNAGYAWVPGENVRYSVGKDGSINVVGKKGEAFPLRGTSESPGGSSDTQDAPPPPEGKNVVRGLGN